MDLGISDILGRLDDYNPEIFRCSSHSISNIRGISFLSSNPTSFEQDILYICLSSEYLKQQSADTCVNLICTSNVNLNAIKEKFENFNLVVFDESADLFEIHNKIQNIILEHRRTNEALGKILSSLVMGKGLQYMLESSYELLKNPMVITDANYKLLAYTKGLEFNDPMYNEIIKYGYVPNDALISKDSPPIIVDRENYRKGKPYIVKMSNLLHRRMYGRITAKEHRLAHLIIYEVNKPFEDNDIELANMLCDAFSLEIQKTALLQQKRVFNEETFFTELLDGKLEEMGVIRNTAEILNLRPEKKLYIFSIDLNQCDINKFSLAYVQKSLEEMIPCCLSAHYEDWIVMLVSCETEIFNDKNFLSKLYYFLKNTKVYAGLSMCFCKLSETRKYFLQSVKAMELSLRLKKNTFLCSYKDYYIYDIIEMASEKGDLAKSCHPLALEILEHDYAHNTFYAETLYAYLIKFKDNSATASYLHIHRNTLNYRLGRLEETFYINWEDHNTLLDLLLSFKILEYHGLLAHHK
ncbi:hypothetical protein OXPF_42840 [Oxobacter pfennigii]|uniref:PucR C-terminal helix-turn-helix domain-containing protein n=1 Tax=Oxobacter pfennigii TaxID=36849 RepID=A0A0P8W4A8_9CLOT|nr:helix-turn-helix domain-containing protein [Oxobacter pfennigii]KPU42499.1 hypothetical protein OXPF_42840 [Oxobacter pfennigii]